MESVIKVCYVRWQDVTHFSREAHGGWFSRDEIEDFIEQAQQLDMKTVGWLVYQDDQKLVIAGTANDVLVSDLLIIPRALVTELRLLEDPPADPSHGPVPVIVPPDSPAGESENVATMHDGAIRLTPMFRIKRAANDAG